MNKYLKDLPHSPRFLYGMNVAAKQERVSAREEVVVGYVVSELFLSTIRLLDQASTPFTAGTCCCPSDLFSKNFSCCATKSKCLGQIRAHLAWAMSGRRETSQRFQ